MRVILSLVVLLVMGAQVAEAQRWPWRDRPDRRQAPVEFGVRGGYDFDAEVGSAGAQLRVPLLRQLLLVPSGDVYFADEGEGTSWQLNADLVARPDELGGVYLGVGAAFLNRDFDGEGDREVEAGYNLLGGIEGSSLFHSRIRPFVEGRWSFVDEVEPFRLVLGINTAVN